MVTFWAVLAVYLLVAVWLLFRGSGLTARSRLRMIVVLLVLLALAYLSAPLWQYYILGMAVAVHVLSIRLRGKLTQILLVVALLLIFASGFLGYMFPSYEENTLNGKYEVGHVVHYHDMTHIEMNASTTLEERLVPVKIWFRVITESGV